MHACMHLPTDVVAAAVLDGNVGHDGKEAGVHGHRGQVPGRVQPRASAVEDGKTWEGKGGPIQLEKKNRGKRC